MEQAEVVRLLFGEWIQSRLYVIADVSSDLVADYRALCNEARDRATALGFDFAPYIPDYVNDAIKDDDFFKGQEGVCK